MEAHPDRNLHTLWPHCMILPLRYIQEYRTLNNRAALLEEEAEEEYPHPMWVEDTNQAVPHLLLANSPDMAAVVDAVAHPSPLLVNSLPL